jgi:hypothetical protein
MHDGWQRWLVDMRARKAADEIERFPGGTRMSEKRQMETMQRRMRRRSNHSRLRGHGAGDHRMWNWPPAQP